MPFPEDVVRETWERAGVQCECRRRTHSHFYIPCGKPLVWGNMGRAGHGGWDAHNITSFAGDVLSNCEILCWDCYDVIF